MKDSGSPTSEADAAAATRSVQTVDAGDHIVGQRRGFSSGQSPPEVRKRVASPDETLIGCTVAHSSSCSCCGDSLNASASASSMLTFSDDVATTTLVQPSSAKSPSPRSPPSGPSPVHAASASAATNSTAPAAVARAAPRPLGVGVDGAEGTDSRGRRGTMGTE